MGRQNSTVIYVNSVGTEPRPPISHEMCPSNPGPAQMREKLAGGLEMAPRFRVLTVEVSNKAVICTICLRRDEKASHLKVRVKYENLTSVAFFQFFYLEIDRC